MKLGFGLYRHQLNDEFLRFATQCGTTHIVVHLVDYFSGGGESSRADQPVGVLDGEWGLAGNPDELWSQTLLDGMAYAMGYMQALLKET